MNFIKARNGNLEILQYLQSMEALSNKKDDRFQSTPLNFALSLKHSKCVDFLILHADQAALNSALQNCSQQGSIEYVKKLVAQGADLESKTADFGATALDRI